MNNNKQNNIMTETEKEEWLNMAIKRNETDPEHIRLQKLSDERLKKRQLDSGIALTLKKSKKFY